MAGRIPSLAECSQRITMGGEDFAYKKHKESESSNNNVAFFQGLQLSTNRHIGIKRVPIMLGIDPKREAAILKSLKHPNIVQCFGYKCLQDFHWIVMDFAKGKSLYSEKSIQQFDTIAEIKAFARQFFAALSYLDAHRIIHYDLDPRNIFWCSVQQLLTLIDFGEANYVGNEFSNNFSFRVAPPEILLEKENYTTEVDLWSAGCVIYGLFIGDSLFSESLGAKKVEKRQKVIEEVVAIIGYPLEKYLSGNKYRRIFNQTFPTEEEGLCLGFKEQIKNKLVEMHVDEVEQEQWISLFGSLLRYEKRGKAADYLALPLFKEDCANEPAAKKVKEGE